MGGNSDPKKVKKEGQSGEKESSDTVDKGDEKKGETSGDESQESSNESDSDLESNTEEKKEEKDMLSSEVDSEDSEHESIVDLGTPERNIDSVNIGNRRLK